MSPLDVFRCFLHDVITSNRGDAVRAVRAAKELAYRVNGVLGEPLCSAEELALRREARIELARLRGRLNG